MKLGFIMAFVALLLAIGGNAMAEEVVGIVTKKQYFNNGESLRLFLDTDSIPGADTVIEIDDIDSNPAEVSIDQSIEDSSYIKFDDAYEQSFGKYKKYRASNIISIDGVNLLNIVGARYATTYIYAMYDKWPDMRPVNRR